MSFMRQRHCRKRSESACVFRLPAIRLSEPVMIIRTAGFERDGAFEAGNCPVIIAQLKKTAALPEIERRFLRLALNSRVECFRCLAVKAAVVESGDVGG